MAASSAYGCSNGLTSAFDFVLGWWFQRLPYCIYLIYFQWLYTPLLHGVDRNHLPGVLFFALGTLIGILLVSSSHLACSWDTTRFRHSCKMVRGPQSLVVYSFQCVVINLCVIQCERRYDMLAQKSYVSKWLVSSCFLILCTRFASHWQEQLQKSLDDTKLLDTDWSTWRLDDR